MIQQSKISAMWKLSVLSTADDSVLRTYEFPDTYLNSFFDAANGWARTPLGLPNETIVKWGYGTTPVAFTDKRLEQPAILPARYDSVGVSDRRWPVLGSGNYRPVRNTQGDILYDATGYFEEVHDTETNSKTYTKYSGNLDTSDNALDFNGNPMHMAWFEIQASEVTGPITEIGTAVRLGYWDSLWLDQSQRPLVEWSDTPWEENETTRPGLNYYSGIMYNYSPAVITRSLVKDSQGNPTSITLAAGEKLRVERQTTLVFTVKNVGPTTQPITVNANNVDQPVTITTNPLLTNWATMDSFVKNAPIEALLTMPGTVEFLTDQGEQLSFEQYIYGWDPVTGVWKGSRQLNVNSEERNPFRLDFTNTTSKALGQIRLGDGLEFGDSGNGKQNSLFAFELSPGIFFGAGAQIELMDFSFTVKRYIERG